MDLEGNLVLELDLPCLPMSRDIAGNIGGTDGLGCGLFWAPDGRRLLITREDGAWMVDLTEGRLRELTVPDVEFVFW
jgi:hypothetical protein